MGAAEMTAIAGWFDRVVHAAGKNDDAELDQIAKEVKELTAGFPVPA
jgi:glycine hydroxymethyltransferase